jgi:Na+-transporting NADH:ubiquinone oxidoreductase subunit NqrB
MLLVNPKLLARASLLIHPRIQMRGAMRAVSANGFIQSKIMPMWTMAR